MHHTQYSKDNCSKTMHNMQCEWGGPGETQENPKEPNGSAAPGEPLEGPKEASGKPQRAQGDPKEDHRQAPRRPQGNPKGASKW